MKKTLVCPKCEGRLIWRIETVRVPATGNYGKTLREAFTGVAAPLAVNVRAKWSGFEPEGGFEAFICKGCGFTEWYAHGLDEIQPDEKNGVQLIDNRPQPERF